MSGKLQAKQFIPDLPLTTYHHEPAFRTAFHSHFFKVLILSCGFVVLTIYHNDSNSYPIHVAALPPKPVLYHNPSIKEGTIPTSTKSPKVTVPPGVDNKYFLTFLQTFPWAAYTEAIDTNNASSFLDFSSKLLQDLLPFLVMPPPHPINSSCRPPSLQIMEYYPKCVPLKKERKVALHIQLGFDVDSLEIHFHELNELVDYFFIIESTRAHHLGMRKPLVWEAIKGQDRFAEFVPKIVHMILDDVDVVDRVLGMTNSSSLNGKPTFSIEHAQEEVRFLKFMIWNNVTKHFSNGDLVCTGDADEVPNRNAVYYLKKCEMPSDPVDIGIWYPMGRIDQIIHTDWPPQNHTYALGDPTVWTVRSGKVQFRNTGAVTRLRGSSNSTLLGGMHMSHYGYLPFQIIKRVTKSESNGKLVKKLITSLRNVTTLADLLYLEQKMAAPDMFESRIRKLEDFMVEFPEEYKQIVKLPWWYDCNRERYPMWEGRHDPRIDY